MRFAVRVRAVIAAFSVLYLIHVRRIARKIASNGGGGWPSGYGTSWRPVAHLFI